MELLKIGLECSKFVFTREPYTFSGGILDVKYPMQRLFKFAEDQVVHYEEVLKPAFGAKMNVISDRVASVSSVVYRQYEGVDPIISDAIHGFIPRPDVVFFIDVPAEILVVRARQKNEEHYDLVRASILRQLYLEYAGHVITPGVKHIVVAGDRPINVLAGQIEQMIRGCLK